MASTTSVTKRAIEIADTRLLSIELIDRPRLVVVRVMPAAQLPVSHSVVRVMVSSIKSGWQVLSTAPATKRLKADCENLLITRPA